VNAHDGQSQLTVHGRLDASNAPAFLRAVQALAAEGIRSVVIDLGGADVSSAGVAALATALVYVQQRDGEVVLKSPRAGTLTQLSQAGLLDRFPLCWA
jgi:anti-anti-sigma factor